MGGKVKKEEFKQFVKEHPSLIKYVKNNEMTWQKFYEMYDLYGSDNDIWDKYIKEEKNQEKKQEETNIVKTGIAGLTLSEVVNWFKNINLDNLQESIGNVQRVLGVVQDFSKKDSTKINPKETYKPRPIYKHFED